MLSIATEYFLKRYWCQFWMNLTDHRKDLLYLNDNSVVFKWHDYRKTFILYCLTHNKFQAKLRGMHEHSASISLPSTASDVKTVTQRIYQSANILQVIHHNLKSPLIMFFLTRYPAVTRACFCLPGRLSPAAPWSWSVSPSSPSPSWPWTPRTSCWAAWSSRRSVPVWRKQPRGKFAFKTL